jgi:TolA-binding protein
MEAPLIGFTLHNHLARRENGNVISSSLVKNLLRGMFFAFLLSALAPAWAGQVVLDEIKIKETDESTVVDILLGLPLEYLKHFPQKTGEILQIQLNLDQDEQRALHKEVREGGELLAPGGGKSVLVYVTYEEGVPGGPYLTLRFSEQVQFEVSQGPERESLRVKIIKDKITSAKGTDQAGGTLTGKGKKPKSDGTDLMMAKARQAITFGNNKGAINLLRKIIRAPESEHTQQANELLGLALERDKQIPRAKYEYKKYLKRYPEGEGSDRVKQRLASLRDLRIKAKRKLRRSKTTRAKVRLLPLDDSPRLTANIIWIVTLIQRVNYWKRNCNNSY